MWDRLNKRWLLLILVPLVLLGFFLGAYFGSYRGSYQPPPTTALPLANIPASPSSFTEFAEVPSAQSGLLLVDAAHGNDFVGEELAEFLSRVSSRGYVTEFMGEAGRFGRFFTLDVSERLELLDEKLRQADSFAVINPETYTREEVDIIERFVQKGGKLLLVADPSRDHDINSLAKRFGISFQPDYLYNTVEHDLSFEDVYIRNFVPGEVTAGLGQIVLYSAGSIKSTGPGLAFTDGSTRSSIVERAEAFSPIASSNDGRVLAIADLTFAIPPQNAILDNDRLLSNIADFLTVSTRQFELSDFPYFFKGEVDILVGRASLVDAATQLKSMLSSFQVGAQLRGVEEFGRHTVYLGLYEDTRSMLPYLDAAGIQVDATLRTPFTPDIATEGTAVVVLHRTPERYVLILLGDSPSSLQEVIFRLESGTFRSGLVSEFVGIYEAL